jgi:hypothetical protein
MSLREQVEELTGKSGEFSSTDREVFESFKQALNRGEVRAAEREEAVPATHEGAAEEAPEPSASP